MSATVLLSVASRGLTRSTRSHPMKASANNRKTATISIDIGKNTSTWLGWTSAGQSCCVRSCHCAPETRK